MGPESRDNRSVQRDFGKIDVKAAISAVRQVLIDVWDPIGVREIAQARDEYEGDAGRVVRALAENAGVGDIEALLELIAVSEIGLPAGSGNPQGAAERIVALGWPGGRGSCP